MDGIQILKGGVPKVTLLFEPSQKGEVVALPDTVEIHEPDGVERDGSATASSTRLFCGLASA